MNLFEIILSLVIGIITGILSGFGIGGGSLLIIYLTNFTETNQYLAGGINLLYFLCCAPTALISHIKNKMIEKKAFIYCTLAGIPTSIICSLVAREMDTNLLRRLFGALLLYVGFKELFHKTPKPDGGNETER